MRRLARRVLGAWRASLPCIGLISICASAGAGCPVPPPQPPESVRIERCRVVTPTPETSEGSALLASIDAHLARVPTSDRGRHRDRAVANNSGLILMWDEPDGRREFFLQTASPMCAEFLPGAYALQARPRCAMTPLEAPVPWLLISPPERIP